MYKRVMNYDYSKNIGMLRKRLQEVALDENYDLKDIFKMVIAKIEKT